MNETNFIHTHQETWQDLEDVLKQVTDKKKLRKNTELLHHLLFLYQTACGHLSIARTRYGSTGTTEYLNGLVTRAHQSIYVSKPNSLSKILRFFTHNFPAMLRKEVVLLLISTGIFMFGFLFSFFFTLAQEDYALSFVTSDYVEGVKGVGEGATDINNSVASVVIFTNNIQVGIVAFALGITFGIGTVFVLVKNGMMLGALAALALNAGNGYHFWALILPHGVPELLCIFICGAAGLLIGKSMLFPGLLSRRSSFAEGGKTALRLLIGTIPLFVLAGLTEGYFTPLPIHPLWKYIVSVVWLLVLLFYVVLRKKNTTPAKQ
ncbi:MAG: stage II sporulation protein M [Thermoclostridium sp.]|nr:stage II sporulation protein M [Thermoclostridium sp.]